MKTRGMSSSELRAQRIEEMTSEQRDRLIVTIDMILKRYARQRDRGVS